VNEFAKLVALESYEGMNAGWMYREGRAANARVQAMELMSFSPLPRALDVDIERWSVSRLGSVWGTPTLNSVARNLLIFPGNSTPLNLVVLISSRKLARALRVTMSVFV